MSTDNMSKDTVTVCSKCLRASCWLWKFPCDQAYEAGTVEKTRDDLRTLDREHSDYWEMAE